MGVVWRATDELLDRIVALKQVRLAGLDPQHADAARQRVLREARVAARLHHPNAVTIFDVIIEGADPWLVLEFVPSRSLGERMRADGPLDPDDVARIGRGVADALAAAHERGIVHRDVKPANVLLGEPGAVKLTDFGISRVVGDLSLTASGMLIGTPAYLAPEVASGLAATPASDVFALGATLYAAVEGAPPFGSGDDGNVLLLLRRAAEGQVQPPQRAGRLTDVLMHMLDPDPQRRPTAAEVTGLLGGQVVEPPQPAVGPPAPTLGALPAPTVIGPYPEVRARRRGWLLGGAVVLTVAAIVAALLVAIKPDERAGDREPIAVDKCDKSRGELVVGLIAPLSGELAWIGTGMRNAAELAVDEANRNCTVPGYRLAFRPLDDTSNESVATTAAMALATDAAMVGVVGPLYGDAAKATQPVLAAAGVVQLAASAGSPSLTRGNDSVARRPYPGYFRVYGNFDLEGDVTAEWLVRREGRRMVAIVDDGSSYGHSNSERFAVRLAALDGKAVFRESMAGSGSATDFPALAARIAAARPDAVFFTGDRPEGGRLSAQLAAAGLNVPLVGLTGLLGSGTYEGRDGDIAVSTGPELALLPAAGPFTTAYTARFTEEPGPYGVLSYDAVTVLVTALGQITAGSHWDGGKRNALVEAVQRGTLSGATGTIQFDAFGDNEHPQYTVLRLTAGDFKPVAVMSPTP